MIARCLGTSLGVCESRPELADFLGARPGSFASHDVPLSIGMDYLVAAISFGPSVPWFFLFDRQPGLVAPILAPCLLVQVQDSRCSRLWRQGTWVDRLDRRHGLLGPPCWADDPVFHGRVFEGEDNALRQLAAAEAQLLLEFPLPWIANTAIAVGSGTLVTDQDWNHTWEANPNEAMTVSPQTGVMFHNPLFADASPERI